MDLTTQLRRRAANDPRTILLEDSRAPADGQSRSLFFADPIAWHELHSLADLPRLFADLEAAHAQGLWSAGYFSYECGLHFEPGPASSFAPNPNELPLAAFGIYREPITFTAARPTGATHGTSPPILRIARDAFAERISRIQHWIAEGDTYQANLTDLVHASFAALPEDLFAHLMQSQPTAFGALFRMGDITVLSASPELFFHLDHRRITVRPMKGTASRGRSPAEDQARAQALAADPKNRAENVMIADLMRSDLGRIAEIGTVHVDKLFAVEQLSSLLQMTTEISAILRPEITLYGLFAALFPSGSIVGAPKLHTLQLLRELETRSRGLYTGAVGFVSPHAEAVFSVAIRTALLSEGTVTMGVGAGITYDSVAESEYAECLLKAHFLMDENFNLLTTVRLEEGRCTLLPLHLDRLATAAETFHFHFDRAALQQALETAAADHGSRPPAKLRLTIARDGVWTFNEPVTLEVDPKGLQAMLWPEPLNSDDPFLHHKTTHRPVYDLAIREAQRLGFVDAIFRNQNGDVTEGAIHSIFVRHGDQWRTPPLSAGVLPGVYRTHLLATMPGILEETFPVADLFTADQIWLTNAVRGIREVTLKPLP